MEDHHDEAALLINVALREFNAGHFENSVRTLKEIQDLYPNTHTEEIRLLLEELRTAIEHDQPFAGTEEDTTSASASASSSTSLPRTPLDGDLETEGGGSSADIGENDATTTSTERNDYQSSSQSSSQLNVSGNKLEEPESTLDQSEQQYSSEDAVEYTVEQLHLVEKVNRSKNYYQVLNVDCDAAIVDIKKAYKRLALQLHPDKNRAPGASEAFKLVSNAASILTDAQKRQNYNLFGGDLLHPTTSAMNFGTNRYDRFQYSRYSSFEPAFDAEDSSTEELYNMFFNRHHHQHQHYSPPFHHQHSPNQQQRQQQPFEQRRPYRPANQRQPQHHHSNQLSTAITFCMIAVLIVISGLSAFLHTDADYNLEPSSVYSVRRDTQYLTIPYYVKSTFERDFQGSVEHLEKAIEEDYIITIRHNCLRERSYRETMKARARSLGSKSQFIMAQELRMPSCDKLSKIGLKRYSLY